MCETFLFFHLCGHVFSKKLWKCSTEILRQLELAKSDVSASKHPAQSTFPEFGSCLDCGPQQTFLKPTLCDKCEQVGIISDWLKSDPAMRFEIIKEWLHGKRADRAARMLANADSETVKIADRSDGAESSTSAEESQGPRTPSVKGRPSRIEIVNSEGFDATPLEQWSPLSLEPLALLRPEQIAVDQDSEAHLDALKVMTPTLDDYLTRAEAVEAEVEVVEQRNKQRAWNAQEDAKRTDHLRARIAAVRKKVENLIAEKKQRSLGYQFDQTEVSLN